MRPGAPQYTAVRPTRPGTPRYGLVSGLHPSGMTQPLGDGSISLQRGYCCTRPSSAQPSCAHDPPLCDIPSGCCFFTGPWTVTRSSLLHVASGCCFLLAAAAGAPAGVISAFAEPRGVLGLCWMWRDVPFARQRRPVVGVLGLC